MLAESGKRVLGPAREGEERRVERFEANRVADHVRPHACARGNHDRVIHSRLDDSPASDESGAARSSSFKRHEFIEQAMIEYQPQKTGLEIAEGDEALGAGISLLKPDVG